MKANHDNFEHNQAIDALKESEEVMRYIVRHDPNAIAIYDCNLHYIAVSERYLHDYNVMDEEIIGKHHYEVFPEIPQKWKDVHQRCLAGAIVGNEDDYFERPDGTMTYNRWECRPWHRVNGEIGGIITYTEVTTERKKAEKALKESEEKYRYLFANNPQPMWIYDLETLGFLEVNDAAINHYGYSREEFMMMNLKNIRPAEDIPLLIENINLVSSSQNPTGGWRHIKKNGEIIYVEITSQSMLFNGLKARHVLINDITERKRAEVIIQQEKDFSQMALDSLPGLFYLFDDQGKFLRWNKNFEYSSGYTTEEIAHLSPFDLFDEAGKINIAASIREVFTNEKALAEANIISKDKTKTPFLFTGSRFHFENKQCLIGMAIDITERKRGEARLLESEERFRSLYENSTIGIYRTTPDGKILLANPTLVKMLGYSSFEDLTSRNLEKDGFEATYERKKFLEKIEMYGEIIGLEAAWTRKDGIIIYVNESTKAIRDSNGKTLYFDGTVEDITERKHTEETLVKLSSAVEQTVDSIVITDRNGIIEYVNHSFEVLTGFTAEESIGKTARIIKSGIYDQEYYENLWKTILSGKVFREEVVNKKKNGDFFEEEKTISPIFGKNKTITHFVGTGVDITKRKRAEKELIEAKEHAEESDRLKSAFLANMSHEVRTPLNSIIGFSELLADPYFEEGLKSEFIQSIITSGNNLLTIISDIMDISKMESGKITIRKSQINVQKFLLGIKDYFSIQAEAKKLELEIIQPTVDDESVIMADPDRLGQVFNNLMSNAIKFTANGRIEIGYQINGKMVEFFIRDTGIGIPPMYHKIIFDRFRQVEAEKTRKYGGNGLGLSISKNLVELMGGNIWLVSEPGKGTVFHFTLPCKES
jgi:hypothetical protein